MSRPWLTKDPRPSSHIYSFIMFQEHLFMALSSLACEWAQSCREHTRCDFLYSKGPGPCKLQILGPIDDNFGQLEGYCGFSFLTCKVHSAWEVEFDALFQYHSPNLGIQSRPFKDIHCWRLWLNLHNDCCHQKRNPFKCKYLDSAV